MRTHFCGLVDETLIGQTVTLAGWTDVARNLGGCASSTCATTKASCR